MNTRPYVMIPAANLWAWKAERTESQQELENRIESRSKDVANLVATLPGFLFPVLRKENSEANDEVLESLLVKEARLRWLVRVAKYSVGANRNALWREVEKELLYLEEDTEAVLQIECV